VTLVVKSLTRRHATLAPLDHYELKLVRLVLSHPGAVHPRDESALRYALALARLVVLRLSSGADFDVEELTASLRDHVHGILAPIFAQKPVDPAAIARAIGPISQAARATRARVVVALAPHLAAADLERELTHRALVLACGGGGGSGYGHLGAFALLESAGLRPQLMAGASMGAIMALFRARSARFELSQVPKIMGELEHRRIFRPFRGENRYTLPSPVRLALRDGIGPYFEYDGVPMRLRDLQVPLLVTLAGIRSDVLQQPLAQYQSLARRLNERAAQGPQGTLALIRSMFSAAAELIRFPDLLRNVVLGATDATREFDVVDAVGFSSCVPGALHFDFARNAPAEVERLEALMADQNLLRLTDGGVADNVPARTAWRAVQRGMIGTRNVFILALDGFSPRLSTPLWLPLQRIAQENVKLSIPYAHHYHPFRRTLSPLDLLPRAPAVMRIVESAKAEMIGDLPFIQRMMEPLPGVAALLAA
jgi:predicted acylesterase/phospholipase RssA